MKAVDSLECMDEPRHSSLECEARVCGKEEHRVFTACEDVLNCHGAHHPYRRPNAGAIDSNPTHISIGETCSSRARGDFSSQCVNDAAITVWIGVHLTR